VDVEMKAWSLAASLFGGVGVFLLGMTMMTDGLKLAAGPALERILAAATRTRWHALASGVLVTAVVQSSSAVTVAAIGFVNAGLLSLAPALWVLFGANVGTTMTSWIVALIGFKFSVEALALPLVGAGVALRLTGQGHRRGAIGTALAGFGLLFLGIALLQEGFAGLSSRVSLPPGEGALAVLAQVAAGIVMTLLTQSSSASMVIAITAAQGGLLSTQGAAAVVIGANIGTTATAVMAAIGATPNARRAAAAHVAFNVITAVVALLLLPWLIDTLARMRQAMDLPPDPAVKLALFHTSFNVLGVVLMWPLAGWLTRRLQARFRRREEDEAQPRYLDDNVLAVPTLALDALEREMARVGQVAARMARRAVAGESAAAVEGDRVVLDSLDAAAESFVERMSRREMPQRSARRLGRALRVLRYHETTGEQALQAAELRRPTRADDDPIAQVQADFDHALDDLLALCDPARVPPGHAGDVEFADRAMEATYEHLKSALLEQGAIGRLSMAAMETDLRRCSALRRAGQQARKAYEHVSADVDSASGPPTRDART
jgi:phosphate:Na+ symporter